MAALVETAVVWTVMVVSRRAVVPACRDEGAALDELKAEWSWATSWAASGHSSRVGLWPKEVRFDTGGAFLGLGSSSRSAHPGSWKVKAGRWSVASGRGKTQASLDRRLFAPAVAAAAVESAGGWPPFYLFRGSGNGCL